MKRLLRVLAIIIILPSCDCNQVVRGTLVDNATGQPLANIIVFNKTKSWDRTKTDSQGRFQLSSVSGGYRCPAMTVAIADSQYQRTEVSIEAGGEKEIRVDRVTKAPIEALAPTEAIRILRHIFEEYKHNEEGIDDEDNKRAVTRSLQSLKTLKNPEDLELLIDVWHYYDPTDYSCRQLVVDVLRQNRTQSIQAVRKRMKHKKSWETGDSEFKYLLEDLQLQ